MSKVYSTKNYTNPALNKKRWLFDDDDKSYLSTETRNRRADQKLLDNITSALYRLELENIKPSFEVKLRTGLHRGPNKSTRERRTKRDSTPTVEEFERSRSRAPSYAPSNVEERVRDIEYRALHPELDEELPSLSGSRWCGAEDGWTPAIENYRSRRYDDPYYQATVEKYATLPRRWLRELEMIEEGDRRHSAVWAATRRPPARRPEASDEYNDLLSYIEEPTPRAPATTAGPRFLDDDHTVQETRDRELEYLLDRPFGGRNQENEDEDIGIWRTRGSNDPVEYINLRY